VTGQVGHVLYVIKVTFRHKNVPEYVRRSVPSCCFHHMVNTRLIRLVSPALAPRGQ